MSREYKGQRIVIYPSYFDTNLSRREGRRVPLSLSVPNPSLDDLVKVCERLGLNPAVEHNKAHPRQPLLRGRVIVDKRGSKLETLYHIARTLRSKKL